MSPASQTMLSRFAVVTSIFALVMVGVVAATRPEGGSGTSGPGAPVAVALSEFAISPATVTVPKGGSIAVTNNGSVAHNVGVTDTALKTRDLNGGETDTLDLSELDPGTYELYCAVSGHKEAGMTAVLIITDGSAGAAEEAAGAETSHHEDISTLDPSDAQAQRIQGLPMARLSQHLQPGPIGHGVRGSVASHVHHPDPVGREVRRRRVLREVQRFVDAEDETGRHRTCHRELQAGSGRRRARAVDQLRQVQQARGHRGAAGGDHHRTRTHRPSVAALHLPPAVHGLLQA